MAAVVTSIIQIDLRLALESFTHRRTSHALSVLRWTYLLMLWYHQIIIEHLLS